MENDKTADDMDLGNIKGERWSVVRVSNTGEVSINSVGLISVRSRLDGRKWDEVNSSLDPSVSRTEEYLDLVKDVNSGNESLVSDHSFEVIETWEDNPEVLASDKGTNLERFVTYEDEMTENHPNTSDVCDTERYVDFDKLLCEAVLVSSVDTVELLIEELSMTKDWLMTGKDDEIGSPPVVLYDADKILLNTEVGRLPLLDIFFESNEIA